MSKLEYLDSKTFFEKTKELEGGHWTPETMAQRWNYHEQVVNLIKTLNLDDPKKILEMGTMGVMCVKQCDTIDYAERWDFPGKEPTYLHDARQFPWPIEDKSYELFVALRVYQHLVPVQKECVIEAMRIAKKVIIVVPGKYSNNVLPDSKGITYNDFTTFLGGIHPNHYAQTEFGGLYFWDTEKPSRKEIVLTKAVAPKPSLMSRVMRKLKRVFS